MGTINAQGVYVYDGTDSEARAEDMLNRQGTALTAKFTKRKIGRAAYVGEAGGSGGGFTWTALKTVTFASPFPAGSAPVITLTPHNGADHVQFAYPVSVTPGGFTYRVVRLGATAPTSGELHWTAELQ